MEVGKYLGEVCSSENFSAANYDVCLPGLFLELLNRADFSEREASKDKDHQSTVRVRLLAMVSNLKEVILEVLTHGFLDDFDNLRRTSEYVVPILTLELFRTILPLAFLVDERHDSLHLLSTSLRPF